MIRPLKKVNLFSSLSDAEIEKIRKICTGESFFRVAVLFNEGATGDYFGEMALAGGF